MVINLASCLYLANRKKESLQVLKAATESFPHVADLQYIEGEMYLHDKKYNKAKYVFETILTKKNLLTSVVSFDFLEYLPHKYLGIIYESENNLPLAVQHYSKALSINDSDDDLWVKLITLLAKNSSINELEQFLYKKCLTRNNMNIERFLKILLKIPVLEVQKLTRLVVDYSGVEEQLLECVLLKNLLFDGNIELIEDHLNQKSINQIVQLLSHNIFSLIDFMIVTLLTDNGHFRNILYNLKISNDISNLLNLLFKKESKKLTEFEWELLRIFKNQVTMMNLNKELIEILELEMICV